MGRHTGVRAQPVAPRRGRIMVLTIGITVTLVAWGFLVWTAIDFGAEARGGETPAWAFLGLATVGATACLFLTLILTNRVRAAMRTPPRRPRAVVSRGHRAR